MARSYKRAFSPFPQHLYILGEEGTNFKKVGITWAGAPARMASLQCGNPRHLKLEFTCRLELAADAQKLEKILLVHYGQKSRNDWASEWFRTEETPRQLRDLVKRLARAHGIGIALPQFLLSQKGDA